MLELEGVNYGEAFSTVPREKGGDPRPPGTPAPTSLTLFLTVLSLYDNLSQVF